MTKKAVQPSVNIGLVGHVDHGKTTLVKSLSGKWTDTHSEEIRRGITIRLGYADILINKCEKCGNYTIDKKCECGGSTKLSRKISLVDAPGHESLMATMLSGTTIMDGVLLLIGANEECPQPQTREHLMALEITGIKDVIVIQNKIDLVSKEQALENYKQIKKFLKGTLYEKAPIIPISAQHSINKEILLKTIEEVIPTPKREDSKKDLQLYVARSFDINKPGITPDKLQGGILGGTIKLGTLKVGEEIEIRPGRAVEEKNQKVYYPITSKVVGAMTGGENVKELCVGGSVAVMTELDPAIVKSDNLTGSVVGHPGKLPPVLYNFTIKTHLLKRVVGSKEELKVEPIKMKEILMLNVNSASTVGIVTKIGKNQAQCSLKIPVCADVGSRVAISRRIGNRFRLIGYGVIQ